MRTAGTITPARRTCSTAGNAAYQRGPCFTPPVANTPAFAPNVIEVLTAVVALGGEAAATRLAETCGLTRAQLTRQLDWMERSNLINQVHSRDGRTWVRATVDGRAALNAAESSGRPSE